MTSDSRLHTGYRVSNRPEGTFIMSPRGMIASMEAGYQQTREQDAAFIVRAVNAHDALVAVAERIAAYFEGTDSPIGTAALAALALARGIGQNVDVRA